MEILSFSQCGPCYSVQTELYAYDKPNNCTLLAVSIFHFDSQSKHQADPWEQSALTDINTEAKNLFPTNLPQGLKLPSLKHNFLLGNFTEVHLLSIYCIIVLNHFITKY